MCVCVCVCVCVCRSHLGSRHVCCLAPAASCGAQPTVRGQRLWQGWSQVLSQGPLAHPWSASLVGVSLWPCAGQQSFGRVLGRRLAGWRGTCSAAAAGFADLGGALWLAALGCRASTGVVSLQAVPMAWDTADRTALGAWRPAHDDGTTSALVAGDHVVVFGLSEVCGLNDICGHVRRPADATLVSTGAMSCAEHGCSAA